MGGWVDGWMDGTQAKEVRGEFAYAWLRLLAASSSLLVRQGPRQYVPHGRTHTHFQTAVSALSPSRFLLLGC